MLPLSPAVLVLSVNNRSIPPVDPPGTKSASVDL